MTPYYERGGIQIFHGDCREVLPTLDRSGVGVVVIDPPYGIRYATNFAVRGVAASWRGQQIAGDESTDLRDWIVSWADAIPMFVFGSWKVARPASTRGLLIWDKGPASGMGDLSFPWKPSFEEIYVIGQGFHGRRDEGVIKGCTVLTWESMGRSHQNEKPVSLIAHLIGKTKGPCLDPCMGTGASLVAAKRLGRSAIGCDVEERYCETAALRLQQDVLDFGEAAS